MSADAPPSDASTKWTLAAVVAVWLFLTVAVGTGEVRDAHHGLASEAWPTVDAVVTRARPGRGHLKRFAYEYTVDHTSYEGRRAGFMHSSFHQEYELHDEGDTIRVHVDPEDPSRAVVRPGVTVTGAAETLGVFALLLSPWVLVLVGLLRSRYARS